MSGPIPKGKRDEITHACPPGDSDFTPCCGRSFSELPATDRVTLNPGLVTCGRFPGSPFRRLRRWSVKNR